MIVGHAWRNLAGTVGVVLLAGCSTAQPPGVMKQAPGAESFATSLRRARLDSTLRRHVVIEAEGLLAQGVSSVLVFGDGVGVWNGKRQFRVTDETIAAALELIETSGFAAWPTESTEPEGNAMEVFRRLAVSVGEISHQVIERNKRPARPSLQRLLGALVDLLRPAAEVGVEVNSLEEGLRRLVEGVLAPHVFEVNAMAPRLPGGSEQPEQGWQLVLQRNVLSVSRYGLEEGVKVLGHRAVSPQEVAELAEVLLAAEVFRLPAQVHLPEGFFQLRVEVLGQKITVQGRTFAGRGTGQGSEAQPQMEAVRKALAARFRREAQRIGEALLP